MTVDKVRENRTRRQLARRGLMLVKSRRRDTNALDYGGYMIVDLDNRIVAGANVNAFELSLEDVDDWLKDVPEPKVSLPVFFGDKGS